MSFCLLNHWNSKFILNYSSAPEAADFISPTLLAVNAIGNWMYASQLSVSEDKTQFLWLGTRQQLAKRDLNRLAVTSVHNLGVVLDSNLKWESHH